MNEITPLPFEQIWVEDSMDGEFSIHVLINNDEYVLSSELDAEYCNYIGRAVRDYPALTARVKELEEENARLRNALLDMLSGWRYIRDTHGDLYGVGWDRAQDKAEAALNKEPT